MCTGRERGLGTGDVKFTWPRGLCALLLAACVPRACVHTCASCYWYMYISMTKGAFFEVMDRVRRQVKN